MSHRLKSGYVWALIWIYLEVINVLSETPPNIIFILTDDQDLVLEGMVSVTSNKGNLSEY